MEGSIVTRYTFSLEPSYNKGPRDWTNMFAITRFRYDLIQWNLDITKFYITKVLDITNDFLHPSNSKIYEKEPRYNKTSL